MKFHMLILDMFLLVLIRVVQRNRNDRIDIYIYIKRNYIYIYIRTYIHIYLSMKKWITGNWLMQLWRLINTKICSQTAGDQGEAMVRF